MIERHEYMGVWWVPADEDAKLYGTLTIDQGASALKLIGDFGHELISDDGMQQTYSFDLAEQPRIVGVSTDGKPITLEGHLIAPYETNTAGMTVATYQRNVAVIGRHFTGGEEICFDEISVRLSDLSEWTRVSGFRGHMDFEELPQGGMTSTAIEVRYEPPEPVEFELSSGEKISIHFGWRTTGIGGGPRTDLSVSQEAVLHLRSARPMDLERVFERVSQLRNFLSLAVGRPVTILSVAGLRDDHADQVGQPRPIEIFWESARNPDPPERPRAYRQMLFTLPDIEANGAAVLTHWFAKQERLQPVFDLFFGIRHQPGMPLEVRFLTYAQAIETYDYRRRRRGGRYTLAQRMEDVLDQCKTVSRRVVGDTPADRVDFIEDFKTARNYYTHYDPAKKSKAATGAALFLLFTQLQALIETSLLRQLGFGCRTIDQILERSRRYAEVQHFRIAAAAAANSGS